MGAIFGWGGEGGRTPSKKKRLGNGWTVENGFTKAGTAVTILTKRNAVWKCLKAFGLLDHAIRKKNLSSVSRGQGKK